MSLINKMLSDLEHRQSYQRDKDHIVLDGLTPVALTGFRNYRLPYNFLAISFFFAALGIALSGYHTGVPIEAPFVAQEITVTPAAQETGVPLMDKGTGMKLDIFMPAPVSNPVHMNTEAAEMGSAVADFQPMSQVLLQDSTDIDVVPAVAIVEESAPGRMDIRRSMASAVDTDDRLLTDAGRLYAGGEFKQGDAKMLALLQQQPLHVQARLLYVSSLLERGHRDAASRVLAEGLNLDPGISAWAKVHASLLADEGRTGEAVSILTRGMPAVGSDNEYYSLYAALLQRLARHGDASEIYRLLLSQQPGNGLWWLGLAISLDAMKNMNEALYAYNKALEGQSLNQDLRDYVQLQIGRLSG